MKRSRTYLTGLMATILVAALTPLGSAWAANTKVTYGMPALQANQSWFFVADALGYWKDQGLDAEYQVLNGGLTTQALAANDLQFAAQSPTILTADAHGQKLITIATVLPVWMEEIILSNDAAKKTGIDPTKSTMLERAKALKGMKLSANGVNTIDNVFLNHVLILAGLDPQKDTTISPIDSPSVNQAMDSGRIDGFVRSPPWTTIPVLKKTGVLWISGERNDVPDVDPAAESSIAAQQDYCAKNADTCRKFLTGAVKAFDYMRANPEKSLELIAPHFKDMDPELLKRGILDMIPLLSKDGKSSDAAWENTQRVMIQSGAMKQSEAFSKFDGVIYTNAYLP